MDREIIKNIKKLNQIEPPKIWKESLRKNLLAQFETMTAVEEKAKFLAIGNFVNNYIFSLKHAYVPALIILLMISGGSIFATQIAKNSLPGELLYQIKIASEKTQVSLTFKETGRIKKEVVFASRRLEELNSIEKSDQEVEKSDVEVAQRVVEDFHQEISKVNNRLDDLKNNKESSPEMLEVAKIVDEKAQEFENTLAGTADKASPEAKRAITAALNTLSDVNFKALGIMVEDQVSRGETIKDEEIIAKLENKIKKIEKKISSLSEGQESADLTADSVVADSQGLKLETQSQINSAAVFLDEAKEFLANNNLKMALEKMEKSQVLAVKLEQVAPTEEVIQDNINAKDLSSGNTVSNEESQQVMPPENQTKDSPKEVLNKSSNVGASSSSNIPNTNISNPIIPNTTVTYPQPEPEESEIHDFYGGMIEDNSANNSQIQGGIWKTKKIVP